MHSANSGPSKLSTHARQRLQQRGFQMPDLETVRTYGEPVEGGYLMSNRAIEQRIRQLRLQMQQLDRLRGHDPHRVFAVRDHGLQS